MEFAIEEGVPNLLLDEASQLSLEEWSQRIPQKTLADTTKVATEVSEREDDTPAEISDQGQYDRKGLYDSWGDKYEKNRYGGDQMQKYLHRRTSILDRMLNEELARLGHVELLEVGCGTGLNIEPIVKNNVNAYALDISEIMLQQAKERFSEDPRVRAIKGSAFCLPFADSSLDMVFATRFIHQFPAEEKASIYQELYRVTKPGGLVVVEFYASSIADWFSNNLGRKRWSRPKHRAYRKSLKYPGPREVREVVAQPYRTIPLKVCGTSVLSKVLGQKGVDRMVSLFGNVRGLVNLYFVVSRAPSDDVGSK